MAEGRSSRSTIEELWRQGSMTLALFFVSVSRAVCVAMESGCGWVFLMRLDEIGSEVARKCGCRSWMKRAKIKGFVEIVRQGEREN